MAISWPPTDHIGRRRGAGVVDGLHFAGVQRAIKEVHFINQSSEQGWAAS
jgi:hypothetical protein